MASMIHRLLRHFFSSLLRPRPQVTSEVLGRFTTDILLMIARNDGRILDANEAAIRAYGYSKSELLTHCIYDLQEPEARPLIDEQMAQAEAEAEGVLFETTHRRKDGSTFPVEVHFRGVTIGSARVPVSVIRDITARKQAEEKLERTNQRLWSLMQALPVGVGFSDDASCERISGNPAMFAQFEAAPDVNLSATALDAEALGRKFRYFSDGREIRGKDLPLQLAVRENREVAPVELEVELPSGRRWFSQLRAAPIRTGDGQVIGGVAVSIDITARKRAEAALAEAVANAESANQAKDRFIASLSHELRTPLTPIIMAAQMIESGADATDHDRELMEVIKRNVGVEARLIDDLLDITRVIHGKVQMRLERIDMHEAIMSAFNVFEKQCAEKFIAVELKLKAEKNMIYGDHARIEQIFWNLLSNALKYTPPHGRLRIVTKSDDLTITAEVSDTGCGIKKELLPHIFEAFEQGERGRFGGLGLGLAITKSLVELHHGAIAALSAGENTGATFVVTMPLYQEPASESAEPEAIQPSESEGPKSILVVEDHEDTAGLIQHALELKGHSVSVARNVKEAIRAGTARQFDVLFCDLGLPDGTGIDVIKNLGGRRPKRTVALSGFGQPHDIQRSLQAGFDMHVIKPLNIQELHRLLFAPPK